MKILSRSEGFAAFIGICVGTLLGLVLLVLIFALLVGCSGHTTKYGPVLTEPATVQSLAYVPRGHGSGVGMTMKGEMSVSSVDIPERYAVVFQCRHGSFVVEGQRARELFGKVRQGQRVAVHYREVMRCPALENDGTQKPCVVRDLDFLDATATGVE